MERHSFGAGVISNNHLLQFDRPHRQHGRHLTARPAGVAAEMPRRNCRDHSGGLDQTTVCMDVVGVASDSEVGLAHATSGGLPR
jgi:hypothetical protein